MDVWDVEFNDEEKQPHKNNKCFISIRMDITDNQGSRACLKNTGKNSPCSRLA